MKRLLIALVAMWLCINTNEAQSREGVVKANDFFELMRKIDKAANSKLSSKKRDFLRHCMIQEEAEELFGTHEFVMYQYMGHQVFFPCEVYYSYGKYYGFLYSKDCCSDDINAILDKKYTEVNEDETSNERYISYRPINIYKVKKLEENKFEYKYERYLLDAWMQNANYYSGNLDYTKVLYKVVYR